jgi:hypothetical protein
MGIVTYIAVKLGAFTLVIGATGLEPVGIFLVGYLGGFFESFSSQALRKAAGLTGKT